MNISPGLQSVIIIFIVATSLFTLIAIIFYKLGKKEKIKTTQENKIMSKVENEFAFKPSRSSETKNELENKNKNVDNDDKSVNNKHIEEREISLPDLYFKKIEAEINNEELIEPDENDKLLEFKFLKYTSNGYKPAIGDKEYRILRWR